MPTQSNQTPQESLVQHFINNYIYAPQSHLVEELLEKSVFAYEDIGNVYSYPEWSKNVAGVDMFFQGGTEAHKEKFILKLERMRDEAKGEDTDEIDEAIREIENLDTEPQEIYEWWLVNSGFADTLAEHEIPVIRNDYGTWWGRTETGNPLIADSTLNAIARFILYSGDKDLERIADEVQQEIM